MIDFTCHCDRRDRVQSVVATIWTWCGAIDRAHLRKHARKVEPKRSYPAAGAILRSLAPPMRRPGRHARDGDGKCGSSQGPAFDRNRASVGFDDGLADIETQAESAVVPCRDATPEAFKQMPDHFWLDADAMIGDRQPGPSGIRSKRDLNRSAGAELDGVAEKVGDGVLKPRPVPASQD